MTQVPIMSYATQPQDRPEPGFGRKLASALFWFVMGIVLFLVAIGIAALLMPQSFAHVPQILAAIPASFLSSGPVMAILMAVSISVLMRRIRTQRAYVVLGYLEQATSLNLPLAPYLGSAVHSETGVLQRRLRRLNELLQSGLSVASSLARAVPELPTHVAGEIQAAESAGRLPQALRRLLEARRRQTATPVDQTIFQQFYPLFMLLFAGTTMQWIFYYIIPKFQEIFKDFRLQLPWLTEAVFGFSDSLFLALGGLFSIILLLLLFILLGGILRRIFLAQAFPALTRPIIDRIQWYLPLYASVVRDRELVRVCDFLGQAVQQGMTLPQAVFLARPIPQNAAMHRRLDRWLDNLNKGAGPGIAAMHAGMPDTMCRMLDSAERTGTTGETFDFLARHYRWRCEWMRSLVSAAATPLMVLFIGSFVGLIIVALFLPLVKLIEASVAAGGSL